MKEKINKNRFRKRGKRKIINITRLTNRRVKTKKLQRLNSPIRVVEVTPEIFKNIPAIKSMVIKRPIRYSSKFKPNNIFVKVKNSFTGDFKVIKTTNLIKFTKGTGDGGPRNK